MTNSNYVVPVGTFIGHVHLKVADLERALAFYRDALGFEHRLHCAGATDKPSFEPAAFEAIFKATRGIPRRINRLCDLALLVGFAVLGLPLLVFRKGNAAFGRIAWLAQIS